MIMRERSIHEQFEWGVCSKKITTKVQINYTQIYTTVVKMTTKLLRRYVLRRYKIAKTKKPQCGVKIFTILAIFKIAKFLLRGTFSNNLRMKGTFVVKWFFQCKLSFTHARTHARTQLMHIKYEYYE